MVSISVADRSVLIDNKFSLHSCRPKYMKPDINSFYGMYYKLFLSCKPKFITTIHVSVPSEFG